MTMDRNELGRRVRVARQACRMPQADTASRLGVPLSEYEQMESGLRPISARELDRLAYLYGRDIRDFVADDFPREDALADLFVAHAASCSPEVLDEVRRCIALGREAMSLERLLSHGQASSHIVSDLERMLPLETPDTAGARQHITSHLIMFASAAYLRDEISASKLRELVTMAGGSIQGLVPSDG